MLHKPAENAENLAALTVKKSPLESQSNLIHVPHNISVFHLSYLSIWIDSFVSIEFRYCCCWHRIIALLLRRDSDWCGTCCGRRSRKAAIEELTFCIVNFSNFPINMSRRSSRWGPQLERFYTVPLLLLLCTASSRIMLGCIQADQVAYLYLINSL